MSVLLPVGAVGKCMSSPQSYSDQANPRYGSVSHRRTAEFALKELEAARAKDLAAHEQNLPILAANAAMRERIVALMKEAGVPDTWQSPTGRMKYGRPSTVTAPAGYVGDMNRTLPVTDGFEYATHTYSSLLAKYRQYGADAEKIEAEDQRKRDAAAEAEKAKRRADLKLATIIVRYQMPEDCTWRYVLESLCTRDQRIDLAVAMNRTRNDWSDGPGLVRYALDRFKTETPEDLEIARDVSAHVIDWDGDGRCFRDTTWNYDRLFASVADRQLAADAIEALGQVAS